MLLKRWCNLAEVDKFLFLDDIVELVAAALDIVHHGASGQGLATYWQVQILIETSQRGALDVRILVLFFLERPG